MTSTTTRTVVVNAAFLQEVKDDNVILQDLLATASYLLDPSERCYVRPRDLAELFAQLRDQLATHFSLEEALGYLEDVIVTSPRYCERAFHLRAEHETLYLQIAELADEAYRVVRSGNSVELPMLLHAFREFCAKLKRHELAEDELILDALYDELGVGD